MPRLPDDPREAWGEYFGAHSYDPHTLIESAQRHPKEKSSLGEAIASHHEHFHWIQHHGTTWGAFVSLLKFSREAVTVMLFRHAREPERARFLADRASSNGYPLVGRISEKEHRFPSSLERDRALSLLSKRVRMFLSLETLFGSMSCAVIEDDLGKRGDYLSEATEDAVHVLIDEFSPLHTEHEQFQNVYRPIFREIQFVTATDGRPITPKTIVEGAATIHELLFAGYGLKHQLKETKLVATDMTGNIIPADYHVNTHWAERIHDIADTDYGTALIEFFKRAESGPFSTKEVPFADYLSTFLIISDTALNPPLPPTDLSPTRTGREWKDVYPPLRFLRLTDAVVQQVGYYRTEENHPHLRSYISEIARCANLEPIEAYRRPQFIKNDLDFIQIRQTAKRGIKSEILKTTANYFAYISWAQKQFWHLRQQCPQALIFPSDMLKETEKDILRQMNFRYWYIPQFVGVEGSSSFSVIGGLEDPVSTWLLVSVAAHYLLFDLAALTGKPDLSVFPPFANTPLGSESDLATRLLRSLLGIAPW